MLVQQLPPESATATAIRNDIPEDELADRRGDPVKAPWSPTDHLLALLIDEVRQLAWMYAQRHSKSKITPPAPLERPGVRARPRGRIMTAAQIKEIDPRMRELPDEDAVLRYREVTGRG